VSSRGIFIAVAVVVLALLAVLLVVRPAVERGGVTELVLVGVAAISILLFERWLRTR
jgi:hypothetical protein